MHISYVTDFDKRNKADALVIPFWETEKKAKIALSLHISPEVERALSSGDFLGKNGETAIVYLDNQPEKRVVLLGLGKEDLITEELLRIAYSKSVELCNKKKVLQLNLLVPNDLPLDENRSLRAIAEGVLLANYAFTKFKSDLKDLSLIEHLCVVGIEKKQSAIFEKAQAISTGIHMVRDLVNNNACEETPERLASVAMELEKLSPDFSVTVFDRKRAELENLNLFLAVAKGAAVEPRFIIVEYKGNPSSKEKTALVGKGITYDTGGLSLKPADSMLEMKSDMCGLATVLGILHVVASLKMKINIVAIMPATENAIGSHSYKPGDVYVGYNGTSVEVVNTDAEGRLILGDALAYVVDKFAPDRIIDFASLTGAIEIALGEEIAGLFCNDVKLATQLKASSTRTDELIWELPLPERYYDLFKSEIADMKNCGNRTAGSITAALFLKKFVDNVPWAHFDIAGTGYIHKGKEYNPTQATGFGVRMMIDFLESL